MLWLFSNGFYLDLLTRSGSAGTHDASGILQGSSSTSVRNKRPRHPELNMRSLPVVPSSVNFQKCQWATQRLTN